MLVSQNLSNSMMIVHSELLRPRSRKSIGATGMKAFFHVHPWSWDDVHVEFNEGWDSMS